MTLLIGKGAPDFTANAILKDQTVENDFSLSKYISGRKCVLLFYPMDFFPVCTSDIIAINNRFKEFEERNTKIVAVSVDSYLSHKIFKRNIEQYSDGKTLQFPLVSDSGSVISRNYEVLINDAVAIGATFLIDDTGIIRFQMYNDLPIGRNINEMLRQIDALYHHWDTGNYCPANWRQGQDSIANNDEYGRRFFSNDSK